MPEGVQVKSELDEDWGPLLQTLEDHTSQVSSVAFSAARDQLASASWDRTVRVWDAKTGQPLHTLEDHTSIVTNLAFSRDGLYLETDRGSTLLPPPAQSTYFLAPQPPAKRVSILERWSTANIEEML
jgi:WD40 repeat protein